MTQKELEFNKRCALFLQWKNKGMINLEMWVSHRTPNGANTNELLFHSDWNWIMNIKNTICNSIKVDEFNTQYDSVAKGYHCSILPAYKNSFESIYTKTFDTEKEAVIQAINKFLIWYDENNE